MPAETLAAPKPPRCAMCRARMTLLRSEPDAGGGDKCTFTCPKCEFVKTKIVGGPPDLSRYRPPRKAGQPGTRQATSRIGTNAVAEPPGAVRRRPR